MTLHHGDCIEVMAGMEPESVDAIVTDPPYGLEFMGKEWDRLGATVEAVRDSPGMMGIGGSTPFGGGGQRVRYGRDSRSMQAWHQQWAEARSLVAEGSVARVLERVQRQTADTRSAVHSGSGVVGGTSTATLGGDDWTEEPRLEGRRYRVQEAWELFRGPVRASASVGEGNGAAGRLRHGASTGDSGGGWLPADADRVREPREPRSDRQPTDEPDALAGQPDAQAVRVGQVSGGYGEPHTVRNYAGKVWCITVPSGAFVARRNGIVFVTGNSGFPKSKASLKPAWEPIVMARKAGPLRMLAIDRCRIGVEGGTTRVGPSTHLSPQGAFNTGHDIGEIDAGRWPANIVLTDPIFDGGIEGVVGGGQAASGGNINGRPVTGYSKGWADERWFEGYQDEGTYSRFFLIPKSSRSDREPVLDKEVPRLDRVVSPFVDGLDQSSERLVSAGSPNRTNSHPTVKPTDLMRHLVRLATPPGGIVLDPFLGSGTTALAAEMEGFPWIGIEREAEYIAIAEARLNGVQKGLGLSA